MVTIVLMFAAITIAPILAGVLSKRREKETGPFITNHVLGLTVSLGLVIGIIFKLSGIFCFGVNFYKVIFMYLVVYLNILISLPFHIYAKIGYFAYENT